jgi:hypothetical protein
MTLPDLKVKVTWGELKEKLRGMFSSPGTWIAAVRSPRTRGKTKQERVRLKRNKFGGGPSQKISLKQTSSKVKLLGEEEHYCPYCLEQVTRDDRRGLKKCPICKTWHHADCWGEVGECQVPHYQT